MTMLPESLQINRLAVEAALNIPVPAAWPEDEAFLNADQAAAIGVAIIPLLHKHLTGATITYLFVEDKREKDRVKLGHAAKAPKKMQFLAAVDYIIEFNWTAWRDLTPEQRIALVDHELCHCAGQDDKGRWQEKGHDVEEFTAIIGRWGPWTGNLQQFGRVMTKQLSMLD